MLGSNSAPVNPIASFEHWAIQTPTGQVISWEQMEWAQLSEQKSFDGHVLFVTREPVAYLLVEIAGKRYNLMAQAHSSHPAYAFRRYSARVGLTGEPDSVQYQFGFVYPDDHLIWLCIADHRSISEGLKSYQVMA